MSLSIEELLQAARSGLHRINPADLVSHVAAGAQVVDHRDSEDIATEGTIPGSFQIRRSVLEWRVCPTSENRDPRINPDKPIILVCNDGYSSSLAAESLQKLGITGATDLIGGYRAWRQLTNTQAHAQY